MTSDNIRGALENLPLEDIMELTRQVLVSRHDGCVLLLGYCQDPGKPSASQAHYAFSLIKNLRQCHDVLYSYAIHTGQVDKTIEVARQLSELALNLMDNLKSHQHKQKI